jgi:hypothetical protein
MELVTWIAAGYLLAMPVGYSLEDQSVRDSHLGGTSRGIETNCIWRKSKTEYVQFSWASPVVSHPGGRMSVTREENAVWAGRETKLLETSMFEGTDMQVIVAFQRLTEHKADVRLYAKGMSLSNFRQIVEATKLRDVETSKANRDGCSPVMS